MTTQLSIATSSTPASRRTALLPLVSFAVLMSASACASLSNKERGAIIGATTGAAAGGVIGNNTGNGSTARGAIIGAVIGGTAGAVIGHQMDQQAKELQQNIPGAVVQRVGEGIQVTFESGLLYGFDSDIVRGDARSNLTALAQSLEKYPGSELLIVGHTDNQGDDAYNARLSARRAESASAYLAAQGVAPTRLHTRGLGENEPVAPNTDEAGRQKNRRVEIAIYAGDALRRRAGASGY